MLDRIKRLVPPVILRHARALRVRQNRAAIVRNGNLDGAVTIVPDTVVEHYYHFVFDLVLPLFLALEASSPATRFVVRATGPFLPRLNLLFADRVALAEDAFGSGRKEQLLLGMNPFFVHIEPRQVLALSRHAQRRAQAETGMGTKVLLIERLPTQAFFATAAKSRGGGASRRHIPNHEELVHALRRSVRPPFEFQNVQLEILSFEEQIRLFAQAAVVVGQHGAGLANALWMQPGSTVVELTNRPDLTHFQRLSAAMGHTHVLHSTPGAHADVDVAGLLAQLQNDRGTQAFFSAR